MVTDDMNWISPRPTPLLACLAVTAALVLALPAQAQKSRPAPAANAKTIYCWDEGGRKVCGDALPASAVDNARTELSASGMTTRQLGRAMSPEERSAARDRAARDQAAARTAADQARHERAMVESYDSEDALQRAFEHRRGLIEAGVKTSRLGIDSSRHSLLGLLRRAGEAELAEKPVGKALADNILNQHQSLRRQQALLEQQLLQQETADADLAEALARYRTLKVPAGGTTRNN